MLNVQLKSTILCLKKHNGKAYQLKLQNVNLQGIGLGTESKTIYSFIFLDINMKGMRKKDMQNVSEVYLYI